MSVVLSRVMVTFAGESPARAAVAKKRARAHAKENVEARRRRGDTPSVRHEQRDAGRQGTGEGDEVPEVLRGEVGAGGGDRLGFARNLDDADRFPIEDEGSAHNFLDGVATLVKEGDSLEDGGVRHGGEMIDELGLALAGGARGKGGGAGEGDLADALELGGNEKL